MRQGDAVAEEKGEDGDDEAVEEEVGEEADGDSGDDEEGAGAPVEANGFGGKSEGRHVPLETSVSCLPYCSLSLFSIFN